MKIFHFFVDAIKPIITVPKKVPREKQIKYTTKKTPHYILFNPLLIVTCFDDFIPSKPKPPLCFLHNGGYLYYSTVTDFAKFLGLSMSLPLQSAA